MKTIIKKARTLEKEHGTISPAFLQRKLKVTLEQAQRIINNINKKKK